MKLYVEKELFQWEKNRYIFLELLPGEVSPNFVQFYNKKSTYGPEIPVFQNKVKIPDYLLKDCFPIMALACIGEEGATEVLTRREFKVIKRVKPENYREDSDDDDDEFYHIIYDGGEES